MPGAHPYRLLVVEDNPAEAELLAASIRELPLYDFSIVNAARAADAAAALKSSRFDAVILDLNLPDSSGLRTLEHLEPLKSSSALIVLSGGMHEQLRESALASGADDVIGKDETAPRLLARSIMYTIERSRAERNEAHFARMIDSHPDALIVTTTGGEVLYLNDAAVKLFGRGREEFIGSVLGFSVRDGADSEIDIIRPDGSHVAGAMRVVEFTWAGDRAFLASIRDVTSLKERHALEEQLRQSRKLESLGKLAGGVAHDFNNTLSVILGYSQLLDDGLPPADPAREFVHAISSAADHAANLTRQLLAFGRQEMMQPRVLNLNEVVRESLELLQRVIGEDIEVRTILDPALGLVNVDPSFVSQIILNLAANARDAMPAGGTLTFETRTVQLDEAYSELHNQVSPGDYIMLAVTDTGVGMDAATRERIFDPFFTTKEKGKGTGLGLATVYGIVKQSGGFIWVYSEPGHGTTFKLYFPACDAPQPLPVPTVAKRPGTGNESILLVEDDDVLRRLAKVLLAKSGFAVTAMANSAQALEFATAHPGDIDLLLTDMILPGMNGRALAEEIMRLRPGIKVLYISGYTDDMIVRQGLLNSQVAFLQKPYNRDALISKIREVLDA